MAIVFKSVDKCFGTRQILKNLSFEVKPGEILFILGRSGVGKSVTLKHLVGLLAPDQGSVFVDALEVTGASQDQLAQIRSRCGMVFQHPALLDSLTLAENVGFGLRQRAVPLSEQTIATKVHNAVIAVGLDPSVLVRYPREISYGMQKRASMARTIAIEPRYLLFDEPTTGLDPVTTTTINRLIAHLSRSLGAGSIVVSHDMRCALEIADRILFLDRARVVFEGTVSEIRNCGDPLVQDFLKEALEL